MNKLMLIISLSILSLLASCAKPAGKTSTKFKIGLSAIVDMNAVGAGGAMLWGRSDKGEMFGSMVSTGSTFQQDLSNGGWSFWIIAWEGGAGGNFKGKTRCAKSQVALTGADVQVAFNLSNAACAMGDFTPSVSTAAGYNEFPLIYHNECNSLADHNGVGCGGTSGIGYGTRSVSKRLLMMSFRKPKDGGFAIGGPALVSDCISSNAAFTNEHLPSGNGVFPGVTIVQSFFSSATCDETDPKGFTKEVYEFGLRGTPKASSFAFVADGTCNFTSVMEPHCSKFGGVYSSTCTGVTTPIQQSINPGLCTSIGGVYTPGTLHRLQVISTIPEHVLCSGSRMDPGVTVPHPFAAGLGTSVSPYSICREYQLNAIDSLFVSNHFILNNDLDMNRTSIFGDQPVPTCTNEDPGANFVPIGGFHDGSCNELPATQFTGTFNGNNHSISNIRLKGDLDDFGFIRFGGGVKNLILNNIEIEGRDYVGAVIGRGSSLLQNITVNEAHIRGKSFVGGVSGSYNNSNEIVNVHVNKAEIRVNSASANSAGGLIGYTDMSTPPLVFKQVSFEGLINSEGDGERIGGLLGYSQFSSTIHVLESFSSGAILFGGGGSSSVGGMVGWATNTVFTNSYSRMNLGAGQKMTAASVGNHGGLLGVGNSNVTNSFYYGSIILPCRQVVNNCAVGSIAGGVAPSLSVSSGAVLQPTWFNLAPADNVSVATIESMKSALIAASGGVLEDVGSMMPRLYWESGACTLPINNDTVTNQSAIGRGTLGNPVAICTKEQWIDIKNYPALHYRIEDNLSLGLITSAEMAADLSGSIDGQGYQVSGFYAQAASPRGGLFQSLSGKIANVNFSAGVIKGMTGIIDRGVIGKILATGLSSMNNFYSVNTIGSSSSGFIGTIAGSNLGSIFLNKVDAQMEVDSDAGLIVGKNQGVIRGVKAAGTIDLKGASTTYVGGVAGVNLGNIFEASSGASILNSFNNDSSTRIGLLVGRNNSLIQDSLVKSHAQITATMAGPLYGQVIGLNEASGVLDRVVAANDMPTASTVVARTKHFVAEELAGASGFTNSFVLGGSVFELNSTSLSVSSCSDPVVTMASPFTNTASYDGGYYAQLPRNNLTNRFTGTHTTSTTPVSMSGDYIMPCSNLPGGTTVYQIELQADFSHAGVNISTPLLFKDIDTFCPSASGQVGNTSYKCGAGEFDIVEDDITGVGFGRLANTYKALKIDKTIPAERPIWSVSDEDGYPRLILVD